MHVHLHPVSSSVKLTVDKPSQTTDIDTIDFSLRKGAGNKTGVILCWMEKPTEVIASLLQFSCLAPTSFTQGRFGIPRRRGGACVKRASTAAPAAWNRREVLQRPLPEEREKGVKRHYILSEKITMFNKDFENKLK